MVSERLVDVTQDYIGEYVEIHGQFRSYNRHEEKHNRLVLSVFSRELKFVEEEDETVPVNQIFWTDISVSLRCTVNSSWKRNCGCAVGSKSSVWKIRLHTMHLLGQKCPLCICV